MGAAYQALLGRDPDPAGALYWASALQRADDLALRIALASSDEYLNRARGR